MLLPEFGGHVAMPSFAGTVQTGVLTIDEGSVVEFDRWDSTVV